MSAHHTGIRYNQTKIIATIGPACSAPETLRELIVTGVDVFRLNASHGSHDDHQQAIDRVRELNQLHGYNIGLMLDLQGPKIRIGNLEKPIAIAPGQTLTLDCGSETLGPNGEIPIKYPTFAKDVRPGNPVLVEDGKHMLEVMRTDGERLVECRVVVGTEIASRKGVNLPDTHISLPSITDKDRKDLVLAIRNELEWVALSFVRTADDVHQLRRLLRENNSKALIIAKIEMPMALKNIDSIIAAADAVMVARGDLGVEILTEEVPFAQKDIVRRCNLAAKPVIVATQMLDSMIEKSRPTRAEATDVANAVLDGADALMLSGETSVGKFPILAVKVMSDIVGKAEQEDSVYYRHMAVDANSGTYYADAVNLAAVQLAREVKATAIVGMTSSGYTAFQLSKHRPQANIFIFTDNRPIMATLNLVWGVRAFFYNDYTGTDETIKDVVRILQDLRMVRIGDRVINLGSMPINARKRTNMIKFTLVE
jgi:pyruvate kinase